MWLKWCGLIKCREYEQGNFWNDAIALYLDDVGLEFKVNAKDQARAPGAQEWRKGAKVCHSDVQQRGEIRE